jgi:hypothetical protein
MGNGTSGADVYRFVKAVALGGCLVLVASWSNNGGAQGVRNIATVQGVLRVGEFFGPPGYGEDAKKDQIGTSYYLQLPATILSQQPNLPSAGDLGEALTRTGYFVQLVVHDGDQGRAKALIGSRVEIVGTLFEANTGYHRTPVLLEVQTMQATSKWRW